MMDAKHPALIINPAAGPVWRRRKAARLIERLRELFPGLSVHPTARTGDAERFARELSGGGCDLILAAGGDGTYNEVINGLRESSVPLAVLPMGTGNSLVRELGLPVNPFRAAEAIRRGVARPVYPGELDRRLFILMVGAGLDADIIRQVPPAKKHLGMLAYVLAGIARLFSYPYSEIVFSVDGREYRGTTGIIAKAGCYGGPFKIAPDAALDRPDLVLCLFKGRGAIRYLIYSLGVMAGLHRRMRGVEFIRGQTVEILGAVPIQVDGDPIGIGPARLTVASKPLYLVYPATSS